MTDALLPDEALTDEQIAELSLRFTNHEPLSDFDYIGFARAAIARAALSRSAVPPEPVAWLNSNGNVITEQSRNGMRDNPNWRWAYDKYWADATPLCAAPVDPSPAPEPEEQS